MRYLIFCNRSDFGLFTFVVKTVSLLIRPVETELALDTERSLDRGFSFTILFVETTSFTL